MVRGFGGSRWLLLGGVVLGRFDVELLKGNHSWHMI